MPFLNRFVEDGKLTVLFDKEFYKNGNLSDKNLAGNIKIKRLDFRYDHDSPILSDIDILVEKN